MVVLLLQFFYCGSICLCKRIHASRGWASYIFFQLMLLFNSNQTPVSLPRSEPYIINLVKLYVRRPYCCHELFGFDVMLDENLKPWILEVNISPR